MLRWVNAGRHCGRWGVCSGESDVVPLKQQSLLSRLSIIWDWLSARHQGHLQLRARAHIRRPHQPARPTHSHRRTSKYTNTQPQPSLATVSSYPRHNTTHHTTHMMRACPVRLHTASDTHCSGDRDLGSTAGSTDLGATRGSLDFNSTLGSITSDDGADSAADSGGGGVSAMGTCVHACMRACACFHVRACVRVRQCVRAWVLLLLLLLQTVARGGSCRGRAGGLGGAWTGC